jgi:hypothetical protein
MSFFGRAAYFTLLVGHFVKTWAPRLSIISVLFMLTWLWPSPHFMPLVCSSASLLGISLLNFWFSREIHAIILGASEVRPQVWLNGGQSIDLIQLSDQLCAELDAYYADGPMRRPRIAIFKATRFKIIGIPGRNPGRAALYIGTGALTVSPQQLAALLMLELPQLRQRNSWFKTWLVLGVELIRTLENLTHAEEWYLRMLSTLSGPARLLFFLPKGLSRANTYTAAKVVVECGRGADLYQAIQHSYQPRLVPVTAQEIQIARQANQRAPYHQELTHWIASHAPWLTYFNVIWHTIDQRVQPISEWVDKHEWIYEDKSGYRLFSFFDIALRKLGELIKTIFSDKPPLQELTDFISALQAKKSLQQKVEVISEPPNHITPPSPIMPSAQRQADFSSDHDTKRLVAARPQPNKVQLRPLS